MNERGWYYLHENGDLIYKRDLQDTIADLRDSPFVKSIWPFDQQDRSSAWRIIIEGLVAGANKNRVKELADKWGCDDEDAIHYAECLGIALDIDGNAKCAKQPCFVDLMESEAGFGDNYVEAISDLCKNMGFVGGNLMWRATFEDLCKNAAKHTGEKSEPRK